MFDSLMDTTPTSSLNDELQRYLTADIEDVKDGLMWWCNDGIYAELRNESRDTGTAFIC